MTEKLPTINLKGKEYVQVKDRLVYLNENYENCAIETEVIHLGNHASFKATVTPDVKNPNRKFVARSGGLVDAEKSYEKLETVAVGRALAFMGIGVIESVASADEIQVYQERQKPNISVISSVNNTSIPADHLIACVCGMPRKFVPPGISKTGKPYPGFYACAAGKGKCSQPTIRIDDAEQYLKNEFKDTQFAKA